MTAYELRERIDEFKRAADADSGDEEHDAALLLVDAVAELLDEPTNVQALALARLMRDRPGERVSVIPNVFDLPEGSWQATFPSTNAHGFTCGIAPDGSVSS